jgi:hypothetical protein
MEETEQNKIIFEKEKELVIARLEVLFPNICFSSGADFKDFSRDDIIKEIRNNSNEGKEFVKTQMEFLRAFKDGSLVKKLNEAGV